MEAELPQGLVKTVGVVRKSSGDIEGGAWKLLSLQQIGDFVEFFQKLRAFSEPVAAKQSYVGLLDLEHIGVMVELNFHCPQLA